MVALTMSALFACLVVLLPCLNGEQVSNKIANVEANDVSHFQRRKLKDFSGYIGLRVKNDKSLVALGEKLEIQLFR